MAFFKHHAIILTSWNENILKECRQMAEEIFKYVSPISPKAIQSFQSFFIPPDGHSEWRDGSVIYDKKRIIFMDWLKKKKNDGTKNPDLFVTNLDLSCIEISYDEDGICKIETII